MIEPFRENIFVTRPVFPSIEEVTEKLRDIWSAKWLTNNGPQHYMLERELEQYLKVPCLSLFNNGTIGQVDKSNLLMSALRIRKGRHHQATVPRSPFAMVERIPLRGGNRLNQVSTVIGNEQAFMRSVFLSDKLLPCFATKVKEQGSLAFILGKGYIASLFSVIPDNFVDIRSGSRARPCRTCATTKWGRICNRGTTS